MVAPVLSRKGNVAERRRERAILSEQGKDELGSGYMT